MREKEEIVVYSNERVEEEESVKREPVSECTVIVSASAVVESGRNVVSWMEREEVIEREMME